MRDFLFHIDRRSAFSLQWQIRRFLVSSITEGHLASGMSLPSTRRLADILGVSRNTIVLVYQGLVDDGYICARERSGYYVSEDLGAFIEVEQIVDGLSDGAVSGVCWSPSFRVLPSHQENIVKPSDWSSYRYPFIYGQVDHTLFPISEWRDCSLQSVGKKWFRTWTNDLQGLGDSSLLSCIRRHILPRRGIRVGEDEILITLGAQNALYVISSLLFTSSTRLVIEDPGYPDMRNIARLRTDHIFPVGVDDGGLCIDDLPLCDAVYVTPSHQFPTTTTMPLDRRRSLLSLASARDFFIIEDDYEFETNYEGRPCPALKSLDTESRVIYVGSLSKSLFPGLRLGFMVGPRSFISEARALCRLMFRHPPTNNQRVAAMFISMGHYDSLIRRLHRVYRRRWRLMRDSLAHYMPASSRSPSFGGTSYWVRGPEGIDGDVLALRAGARDILIESGNIFFSRRPVGECYFRLGFSSIGEDRIESGIRSLSALIEEMRLDV